LLLASGDLGCRSGRLINTGRRTLPCGLAEALDRALGSGGAVATADGCLIGRRNDALRPLHVLACPLECSTGFLTRVEGCARAVVLVLDPEFSPESGVEHLLARLYSLTRAEAKVALQVIAGNRPATIADDFHVNIETVKTQLKAVFQKTDTTGQSELVRTLLPLAMIANVNVV
jgi:DNA-binding CsgD family transcriptional regulator